MQRGFSEERRESREDKKGGKIEGFLFVKRYLNPFPTSVYVNFGSSSLTSFFFFLKAQPNIYWVSIKHIISG